MSIAIALSLVVTQAATATASPLHRASDRAAVRANTSRVKIVDFRFRPGTLTISRGDVVRWKNRGSVTHTSTSSSWDSGRIAPGGTFRKRFRHAGTFEYHCSIHPQMTGTIVVR
jgi:plastocyanin